MYEFNWPPTTFRSESYIGSVTALPDIELYNNKEDLHWTQSLILTFLFRPESVSIWSESQFTVPLVTFD